MTDELSGRTIAILATDGVEQVELEKPKDAVEQAGATVRLLSIQDGRIQAMHGDIDKGDTFAVDEVVSEARADAYDGLILPGGTINPDRLRMDDAAVGFVRDFVASGRPVGAICHGPWTLVQADVVRGRRLTSYPSLRTDIRNAGGDVVDDEVVVDGNLVTSRNPDDLPAFCATIVKQLAKN
ncbi:MAG TPA: type 1 glutamine amidotransferase domain-containing protein [Pseudonocardiaceae bacterium]|jgi:protease I